MTQIRYTRSLGLLPATVPFVGPETQERQRGASFYARLGANENVFGPSPKVVAAMQEANFEIWKYGDPTSFDLRVALARFLNVAIKNVVIGEGIDGLLGYLARMLIERNDNVVTSDGAYPTFNYHILGYGGNLHKVPYKGDKEDLDGLLRKVEETNAKLVYLANPDNPMGTVHTADKVKDFINCLPKTCLLALDEAYIEFAPSDTAPDTSFLFNNVIRLRTFSKGYGMAGARVGYAFGPSDLIAEFEKVRNHFGINRAAQIGSIAAIEDREWLVTIQNKVAVARDRIKKIAAENGLTTLPSAANFVAIDCGHGSIFAKVVLEELLANRIFIRMPFVAPQDRCIRITAGTDADLDLLSEQLPKALEVARFNRKS